MQGCGGSVWGSVIACTFLGGGLMRCYRGVFRGCRTGHGGAVGGGHVRFAGVWGEGRQRKMRRESSSPRGGGGGGDRNPHPLSSRAAPPKSSERGSHSCNSSPGGGGVKWVVRGGIETGYARVGAGGMEVSGVRCVRRPRGLEGRVALGRGGWITEGWGVMGLNQGWWSTGGLAKSLTLIFSTIYVSP